MFDRVVGGWRFRFHISLDFLRKRKSNIAPTVAPTSKNHTEPQQSARRLFQLQTILPTSDQINLPDPALFLSGQSIAIKPAGKLKNNRVAMLANARA
jgi:hypothetical protein